MHVYEIRPRKDHRGVDLGCGTTKPDDAIGYAKFYSRSHDAVIRVYDAAGNSPNTLRKLPLNLFVRPNLLRT
jgi:hypothetical protein